MATGEKYKAAVRYRRRARELEAWKKQSISVQHRAAVSFLSYARQACTRAILPPAFCLALAAYNPCHRGFCDEKFGYLCIILCCRPETRNMLLCSAYLLQEGGVGQSDLALRWLPRRITALPLCAPCWSNLTTVGGSPAVASRVPVRVAFFLFCLLMPLVWPGVGGGAPELPQRGHDLRCVVEERGDPQPGS